jgi:pyridoxal phosphate enzyme (YggS family)
VTVEVDTMLEAQLTERIAAVRDRIAAAARRAGREVADVTLVGVCKTVGRADVDAAYAAGLRDFGENRVQDALEKFAADVPSDLHLHMIGSLQTNKARQVVGRFALVHSVDRVELANELSRRAVAHGITQPVLLQINIAREEQKHGRAPEDAPMLLEHTLALPGLNLQGLMAMAPLTATAEEARPVFAGLRELQSRLLDRYPETNLATLSMGMTNDFTAAIEEGATLVRVGRAIFAERVP